VNKEAIEQELERTGWELDHGFSGHLIIGNSGDLSILAPWSDEQVVASPGYELYDARKNIVCRVRVIPMPLRAKMLLEEHGEDAFLDEQEQEGWATFSTS
jgi:hypothetical protein